MLEVCHVEEGKHLCRGNSVCLGQYVSYNVVFLFRRGRCNVTVLDKHEASDDKLDLTDCAEFVQSNPELRVLSLVLQIN